MSAEDARATYTGSLFSSTSSITSSTAAVTLAATVQDITDVRPTADPSEGDVRHAKVTFVNRDTGAVLCSGLPVGLVDSGDTKGGYRHLHVEREHRTAESQQFTIGVKVERVNGAGRYTRSDSTDNAVVTVSKPIGSMITGGGALLNERTAGQVAADTGKRTSFGFNVKYNKSNTNLQGNINAIVRKGATTYQIKGNSMTSLATKLMTGGGTATFNGKANIQNIADPSAPVSVDGNAALQVTMSDNGEPGSSDTIGITLWNKSGGLWFSSRWETTKTV